MEKRENGFLTSIAERGSYGLYFVGQNIYYQLLAIFIIVYFMDVGIPALTVSVVILIVKIWDAINDPVFGGIVDRIKFKKGKFVPWLRISLFAIPAATVLIFAIPEGASVGIKVAWGIVAYVLWDTAYTICDVPIFGLVTTLTDKLQERTTLMAIGRVAAMIAGAAVAILVPGLRTTIGGWLPMAILLSVIALITMVPICFTAKERVNPPAGEKEIGIREMLRFLAHNKYMLIIYGALLISSTTSITNTLGIIVCRYDLGDESLMMTVSAAMIVPSIIAGVLVPFLTKRFDKFKIFFWSTVIATVAGGLVYFIGYNNLTLLLIAVAVRAFPVGFTTVLMFMFTPDCAEYGHYVTGVRATGIAFSVQTFFAKFSAALTSSVAALCLSLIGYVEGANATQAAGFNDKLWAVYIIVPTAGSLISLFALRFYKLRDKTVQVMTMANAGEITHEEAEARIGGKY
ncbi:MAG: glycoside-pentoside-hexuronide (GPH):cation symporter [Clostridiales Family XIII bacterium]|jgi:sugar (glycoside-pentoside-hexuronide) transporter|nr:glycoside-pentoside-hexuronide (GPH):cation symporter [Clostridiales Family XIII bacterium]